MTVREYRESRDRSNDGSIDLIFVVENVVDDVQAVSEAFAVAPAAYLGRTRDKYPSVKNDGYGLWKITFSYTVPEEEEEENPPPQKTVGIISFEASGVSQHITQCLEQLDYGAESGLDVKNAKVIGANGDSVEGCDALFPQLRLSLTRIPPQVSGEYIKNLARLVGKTNQGPYTITGYLPKIPVQVSIQFDDGELKFLGASPTSDGTFKYDWDASENRTDIDIGEGITIATKKGHEYLWTMFKQKELNNPAVKIPVPHIAFVAKLPPGQAAYQSILGF